MGESKVRETVTVASSSAGQSSEMTSIQPSRLGKLDVLVQKYGVLLVSMFYLAAAPYTKVEESFSVQATHDLIFHGPAALEQFDHFQFSGVVPRSFIGPSALALLSAPFVIVLRLLGASKLWTLLTARAMLAIMVWLPLRALTVQLRKKYDNATGRCFVLILCSQFHLLFYASRPLGNIFALVLVLWAYVSWFKGEWRSMINLFVFATVVFRCDLLVLLAPVGLLALATRDVPIVDGIKWGLTAGVVSLGVSLVVDSYFWQRPLSPEFEVLYFNTALNKSSEWGTLPWHWYVSSALLRALLGTALLVPFGLLEAQPAVTTQPLNRPDFCRYFDWSMVKLLTPVVCFVGLYSLLPHKELRFIIYAIPILSIAAARGLAVIIHKAQTSRLWQFVLVGASLAVAASVVGSMCFLRASHLNYPGGHALRTLHNEIGCPVDQCRVHIGVMPAMTGVSRFSEHLDTNRWVYSKQETGELDTMSFTHLLTENATVSGFRVAAVENGFDGLRVKALLTGSSPFATRPMIYVMEREDLPQRVKMSLSQRDEV